MAAKPINKSVDEAAMQLHEAQSALGAVQSDLEHTQRLATLGLMAAGVAHEINNILTPAMAYAQLAMSNPADQALQTKAIDKAFRAIHTATKIAQAMLGFSGAAGDDRVANISQVMQSALDCLGRDPAKDRIRLTVKVDPNALVGIPPLALQQVLLNVLLNACTAMRKRGGDLTICSIERADGTTMITVADTGPGIPDDVVGNIFQPFFSTRRVNGTADSRTSSGGSGLGLAICRKLVEESNGTIAAKSEPGKGTTLTIVLPTARPERAKAV